MSNSTNANDTLHRRFVRFSNAEPRHLTETECHEHSRRGCYHRPVQRRDTRSAKRRRHDGLGDRVTRRHVTSRPRWPACLGNDHQYGRVHLQASLPSLSTHHAARWSRRRHRDRGAMDHEPTHLQTAQQRHALVFATHSPQRLRRPPPPPPAEAHTPQPLEAAATVPSNVFKPRDAAVVAKSHTPHGPL